MLCAYTQLHMYMYTNDEYMRNSKFICETCKHAQFYTFGGELKQRHMRIWQLGAECSRARHSLLFVGACFFHLLSLKVVADVITAKLGAFEWLCVCFEYFPQARRMEHVFRYDKCNKRQLTGLSVLCHLPSMFTSTGISRACVVYLAAFGDFSYLFLLERRRNSRPATTIQSIVRQLRSKQGSSILLSTSPSAPRFWRYSVDNPFIRLVVVKISQCNVNFAVCMCVLPYTFAVLTASIPAFRSAFVWPRHDSKPLLPPLR